MIDETLESTGRSKSREERQFRRDLINALDQIGITLEAINETLLKIHRES